MQCGNLVAQSQFAFFEPRQLDLVVPDNALQRLDRGIEIAVLLPYGFEPCAYVELIHAFTPGARVAAPLIRQPTQPAAYRKAATTDSSRSRWPLNMLGLSRRYQNAKTIVICCDLVVGRNPVCEVL